jgi:hypothetical protein
MRIRSRTWGLLALLLLLALPAGALAQEPEGGLSDAPPVPLEDGSGEPEPEAPAGDEPAAPADDEDEAPGDDDEDSGDEAQAADRLPDTGSDPRVVALAASALLLTGLGLRLRTADADLF